jgi:predicted permease
MRVPLLAGRAIDETDRRDSPPVVVINQTFARTYFPGQDPIGQRIAFDRLADSSSVWRTIVGVVGDERQTALSQVARPEAFSPMSQQAREGMSLLLRTRESPEKVAPAIRAVIARLDPALAIASISTMDEVWRKSLARDRFLMALVASFAVVGLVLGLVGVYGVVAQVARRRNHEMGIRIALGARAGQVTWLVVRRGVLLAGFGIALGAGGALTAAGLIRTLLYQVAPVDPATFIAVPLLVLGTAALASWIPALRASRADPCQVLRSD